MLGLSDYRELQVLPDVSELQEWTGNQEQWALPEVQELLDNRGREVKLEPQDHRGKMDFQDLTVMMGHQVNEAIQDPKVLPEPQVYRDHKETAEYPDSQVNKDNKGHRDQLGNLACQEKLEATGRTVIPDYLAPQAPWDL